LFHDLRFFLPAKQLGQRWSAPARRVLKAIFCVACALVGVLSVLPSAALPPVSIGDKVEHVVAYAMLALLGCALFERRQATVILGLAAYGAALEWLQIFSPGRSPEIADGVADLIGACVGGCAAIAFRRAMRVVVDKVAGDATECRACPVDGDAARSSSPQQAGPSSPL
jgi:VanZ family protein